MGRFIGLCFFLASCLFVQRETLAQSKHDVAQWLDKETALLINVIDPATTIGRVRQLDLFTNPRFVKAVQMLSDERFPILDSSAAENVFQQLEELEVILSDVEQVSFAVHAIDSEQFIWSVFVRADQKLLTELKDHFFSVDKLLKRSIRLGSAKATDEAVPENAANTESDEIEPDEAAAAKDLGWCRVSLFEDWLVFSNKPNIFEELRVRLADKRFQSLGKARKYRAIALRDSPLDGYDGRISIYGNPVRLRYFLPWITEDRWKRYAIQELPSCGLKLAFTDPKDQDDASIPIVLIDAVAKYTVPTVGYAKLFQQYRPIEIPALAVDPFELQAMSRDESAYAAELARSFDEQNGAGAAEQFWKEHFAQTSLNINDDALPRRQSFAEARYVNSDQDRDTVEVITFEKILDRQAAVRYSNGVVEYAKKNLGRDFGYVIRDQNVWWTIPDNVFPGSSGLSGLDRSNNSRVDLINGFHDAYVLMDEWWIQGDMPAVRNQVELMESGTGEDYSQPIRDLVNSLQHRFPQSAPPVMISYFTEKAWEENLNHVEDQYAAENGTKHDFTLSFSVGDGNSIQLQQLIGGESSGSFELNGGIILQSADDKDSSNNHRKDEAPSNTASLQMVTPMPLGERSEDGYRFELKRREDLQKAFEVMIWKSVTESCPRQLLLYSQGDGNFRLIAGVYRDVDDEPKHE